MSFTTRTRDLLEKNGYRTARVEHYNTFSHRKNDLFGFADVLAFLPNTPGVILSQITSVGHVSDRRKKILSNPIAHQWLEAGNSIRLDLWEKKKNRWTHTYQLVTIDMFEEEKNAR